MTFQFEYPWLFFLLPLPLVVWFLLPAYRERQESVRVPLFEKLAGLTGREPSKGAVILRKNILQWVVAPLAWGLILVAAARPVLFEPPVEKIQSARDLLLAVDLSGSMDSRDMRDAEGTLVDRLTAVKEVLSDFIKRREGDRIGLLFFGTAPYTQVPFTLDHALVLKLLGEAEVAMAGPQTMIGDAIGLATKVFDASTVEHRILVMLTDGNDTNSKVPPPTASRLASARGITIHTIGFGDPTTSGEDLFDEAALREISRITGGVFFRADDRDSLEAVYEELDELEPQQYETLSYRPTIALYQYPTGGLVLLVLLYHTVMWLTTTLRRRGTHHA